MGEQGESRAGCWAPGRTLRQVTFDIDWHAYSNDDLADDEGPNPPDDEGWYVTVNTPDASGGLIGPDYFGPGLASVDEALALVRKWADGRGFHYDPPSFTVTVGKWTDD